MPPRRPPASRRSTKSSSASWSKRRCALRHVNQRPVMRRAPRPMPPRPLLLRRCARAPDVPSARVFMSTEIKVPKLPESVADATLVNWHKKAGDAVARDENLADLETDKVVLEV